MLYDSIYMKWPQRNPEEQRVDWGCQDCGTEWGGPLRGVQSLWRVAKTILKLIAVVHGHVSEKEEKMCHVEAI